MASNDTETHKQKLKKLTEKNPGANLGTFKEVTNPPMLREEKREEWMKP